MKKIKFDLKKDEDNKFKAEMFSDGIKVKEALVTGIEMKEYMEEKVDERMLDTVRKAAKLFKAKAITIKGL